MDKLLERTTTLSLHGVNGLLRYHECSVNKSGLVSDDPILLDLDEPPCRSAGELQLFILAVVFRHLGLPQQRAETVRRVVGELAVREEVPLAKRACFLADWASPGQRAVAAELADHLSYGERRRTPGLF